MYGYVHDYYYEFTILRKISFSLLAKACQPVEGNNSYFLFIPFSISSGILFSPKKMNDSNDSIYYPCSKKIHGGHDV